MVKKLKNLAVFAALATAVVLALISCSQDRPESEPSPIRFAYQNRIGSAICVIAVEKGFFSAHGVNVEPFPFNSGPACAETLYTGAADIAAMGDSTAIITLRRNPNVSLLVSHASGEYRHRMMVGADSGYMNIGDLKGKRIGVKKGTSTYGGLLKYLQVNNLDPDMFEIVNLKPSTMPEALASGSIEAFAASEPTPSLAGMQGACELTTFGNLGNNYPIMTLVNQEFASSRPEDIGAFTAALADAETFIRQNQGAATQIMAQKLNMPLEITQKAMQRHDFTLDLGETVLSSLSQTARFLHSEGVIDQVPHMRVFKKNASPKEPRK
jgi:ABC-type nitrate/sulfonate/bicarbonate transport system substrate-binding protein